MAQEIEHLCSNLEAQGLIPSRDKNIQFYIDAFDSSFFGLGFELRALHLQCMHSTAWATHTVLYDSYGTLISLSFFYF
jgi:hypothetical protein